MEPFVKKINKSEETEKRIEKGIAVSCYQSKLKPQGGNIDGWWF